MAKKKKQQEDEVLLDVGQSISNVESLQRRIKTLLSELW